VKNHYCRMSILLLLVLSVISCATYHFVPIQNDQIQVIQERSAYYPVYTDQNIGMIIYPVYVDEDLMIKIAIKNYSGKTISFTDTHFSVYESDDRVNWKKLKVYTSEEYYRKEKAEYTAGAVLLALGAVASSIDAGRGYTSTTGTIYGGSRYGSVSGIYSSSTSYYDPTAAELARQRNFEAVSQYAQRGKQWLDVLEKNLFYSVDLQPNAEYFGLVFAEKGYSKYYKIICTTPGIQIVSIEYEKVVD